MYLNEGAFTLSENTIASTKCESHYRIVEWYFIFKFYMSFFPVRMKLLSVTNCNFSIIYVLEKVLLTKQKPFGS